MLSWLKGGDKVDHPLANAKKAQKIVADFPYKNPWQTLEDVNYWLSSVNETAEFKADRRYELIDMLDVATRKCQAQLTDTYVTLRDDNIVQEKRIAKTLCDFWTLLGAAYFTCATQCIDGSVPASLRAQVPALAARGLRALRHQVKWVLMRYGVVRNEVWAECGRFAALAESVDGAAKPIEMYGGSNARSSPNDEFLRLVMFWAASPSGLSPVEQDIADRLIVILTPKFRISARHEEDYDYFMDLQGAHPPLRLLRSSPVTAQTRYFNVADARLAVGAMYSDVNSSGNLPSGADLGPAAEANVVARVCKHLRLNWARDMPARVSERRKTAMALKVVHGYQGVLGVVAPANAEGLDFQSVLAHESWVADDVSAGGYGVIVPAGKGDWLRVGIVVAVRSETDVSWHLGVIRRVKADAYTQRHIGIQLISKTPIAVYLRTLSGVAQGRKRHSAILLSARPSPSGSMHIVVRRDLFSGREPIEAMYGQPETTITLEAGGVVESGHDFDWLRYKISAPDR